jgi:hypothetical protein
MTPYCLGDCLGAKIWQPLARIVESDRFGLELLRVKRSPNPLEHPGMLGICWIRDHPKQILVAGNTSAILGRATSSSIQTARVGRSFINRMMPLESNLMNP